MSRSKHSKKPLLLKLALAAVVLLVVWLAFSPYREAKARSIARQAVGTYQSDQERAIGMMRTSVSLKAIPDNVVQLAQWYFDRGNMEEALAVLNRTKAEGDRYWLIRGKATLELGRDGQDSLALSALPEAKKIIEHLKVSENESIVFSARELYLLRLVNSAESLLKKADKLNSSGAALLAQIRLAKDRDLPRARDELKKAIASDPADVKLHELLEQVYKKLGDQKAASGEAAKIQALKAGKF